MYSIFCIFTLGSSLSIYVQLHEGRKSCILLCLSLSLCPRNREGLSPVALVMSSDGISVTDFIIKSGSALIRGTDPQVGLE